MHGDVFERFRMCLHAKTVEVNRGKQCQTLLINDLENAEKRYRAHVALDKSIDCIVDRNRDYGFHFNVN